MNTPQERVPRRTREAVRRLVNEFQTSGLRPMDFCRRHGLAPSTLRRNLNKQGATQRKAATGVRSVAVKLNGAPAPTKGAAAAAALEVVLAGGRRIGVAPGVDEGTLGRLVRVLVSLP